MFLSSRQIATLSTPIGVGCLIFAGAALLQDPEDWDRFGYFWANQDLFGLACLVWAIVAFALRWQQQEHPQVWSAFLMVSGIAYGAFAAAFAFQGSITGVKWGLTCALFCCEVNELHAIISRLKLGDKFEQTPRSRNLQRVSQLWLLGVLGLGVALVVSGHGAIPWQSLASGLSLLAGVGTAATKMYDTYQKIAIATAPKGEDHLVPVPIPIQALAEVNSSLQSELEFKSAEIQRLRDTIVRIRSRLAPDENTELPY